MCIVGSGPSLDCSRRSTRTPEFTGPLHGDELAGAYGPRTFSCFPENRYLRSGAAGGPRGRNGRSFPVTGPKDVITDPAVGTLSEDLQAACLRSLEPSSAAARTYAEGFVDAATQTFLDALERTW